MEGADVVIGVSRPGLIEQSMVESMADDAIVFALANPTPEIFPDEAAAAGATVVATGRSDFANQINNVLAFPGIFKAVVDGKLRRITTPMKQAAARALAAEVSDPTAAAIIPHPFKDGIAERLSAAVLEAADDDDFRS
jgi:malate dehydrogenase (oxaloacetate-decarboxylating)